MGLKQDRDSRDWEGDGAENWFYKSEQAHIPHAPPLILDNATDNEWQGVN